MRAHARTYTSISTHANALTHTPAPPHSHTHARRYHKGFDNVLTLARGLCFFAAAYPRLVDVST